MQPRSGFVQQVKGLARARATQFRGNLDALGLAAAEGGRRLAKRQVTQSNFLEQVQGFCNFWQVLEKFRRIGNAHFQNFGNILALEIDFAGGIVKALAVAHIAGHLDAGQNVHIYHFYARPFASVTATALHVKAETALGVATDLAFGQATEQVADIVPNFRVGRRIAPGRATDRRLVDFDYLVDILETFQMVELTYRLFGVVEHAGKFPTEDLVDKRALAGAGNAGNYGKGTVQRDFHVDVLQVVFGRATDFQLVGILVYLLAVCRNLDGLATAQVGARKRRLVLFQLLHRARRQNPAALYASAGPHIYDAVGVTHGVFVVLHNDQAVTLGTQVLQHFQELVVIPRVESDTGLVQNVKHPLESSPYGTGQADSLGLAAAQGRSLAADVQVAKANSLQEIQATPDFAEDFLAYPQFLFGKF